MGTGWGSKGRSWGQWEVKLAGEHKLGSIGGVRGGGGGGHLLWGMVRAKTKVAALQPTVCAAWLQAWMSIRYSVKWRRPLSTARSRGTLSS